MLLLLACSRTDTLDGDDTGGPLDTADTHDEGSTGGIAEGDLVITEIMNDPNVVDGDFGEWFEVYNASSGALDLNGIEVVDDDGTGFVVSEALPLQAGGRVVFGVSAEQGTNGGVSIDYVYDVNVVKLGNDDDALVLRADGVTVDSVAYDPADGFPATEGASKSLSPSSVSATANDEGAAWCDATSTYGAGDRGTPGAPNDSCG